jgi:HK97 family phage major capsid protein
MNAREIRAQRAQLLEDTQKLVIAAEAEDRDLSPEEKTNYDGNLAEADALLKRAERAEKIGEMAGGLQGVIEDRKAPAYNRIKLGDSEERALAHYIRTGDGGGLMEQRASNDTTMNITTNVDGQYLVPTGHYQQVIARRDESMLATALGVRKIPGKGTTVNVPVDNEDDGEFIVTSESGAFDRDAPATTQIAMTLLMYTKKIDLTYQLLEDEDSQLMAFLGDFVGRGLAKTHNALLLTEVAASGTTLKTFASATVIAVDELEPITFNEALSNYMDDTGSVSWVMQRAVHGEIVLLDDTSIRRYANNAMGNEEGPSLLGFPVKYSAKSGATAASAKSVYFGNWNYVALREAPSMTMLRDPYTRSSYGEVVINYYFRAVYKVLVAEAIGFGVHPSA